MPIAMQEQWFNAKGEKGVIGRFDYAEVIDVAASNEKGEMITKNIPVLIAKTAGSADHQPQKLPTDPIARKAMIDRFPEAWLAFQGENVEVQGTPLTEPFHGLKMAHSEVMKYQLNSIVVWEQIADLSDAGCEHVGFGTLNRRKEVMLAMGKTPPAPPPQVQLSANMTAEQALLTMPGGQELVNKLNQVIAEKRGGAEAMEAAASMVVDMTSPAIQAAIQAAVQAALAAQAPKRKGWPAGKPRGARKAKETTNEAVQTDAVDA